MIATPPPVAPTLSLLIHENPNASLMVCSWRSVVVSFLSQVLVTNAILPFVSVIVSTKENNFGLSERALISKIFISFLLLKFILEMADDNEGAEPAGGLDI